MAQVINREADAGPNSQAETGAIPRISQACSACRRKKIKCDGQQPCHTCKSRDQLCDYPGSKDNASASRQYAASFETRCAQLDALCQKLTTLCDRLSQSVETLNLAARPHNSACYDKDTSHPDGTSTGVQLPQLEGLDPGQESEERTRASEEVDPREIGAQSSNDMGNNNGEFYVDSQELDEEAASPAGSLVRDSYGSFRFIGGALNAMLVEVIQELSASSTTAVSRPGTSAVHDDQNVELPFFLPGAVWPDLPFLPKAEDLPRPPQYVADLLIGLYFDRMHYTFPIVFKPDFLRSYRQAYRGRSNNDANRDRKFLMVFFAICACASSLLPSSPGTQLTGNEYFEKALLLYYASAGEASVERVQCLGLLALCTAGWNTLARSWMFAGQAARAAMDIGLHLDDHLHKYSSAEENSQSASRLLQRQISRRIWWSVYTVDRVMSICLGRPFAAQDEDCRCALPVNRRDEEILALCTSQEEPTNLKVAQQIQDQPLTGFIAFSRLCCIAGRCESLGSPSRTRDLAPSDPSKVRRYMARAHACDKALQAWLESLPDEFRFSANALDTDYSRSPGFTMCVIAFIVHGGSLLKMYLCLAAMPSVSTSCNPEVTSAALGDQCISAATCCISAAEPVIDLVSPSHYLAFCVHYLTLSGVVLIRLSPAMQDPKITDAVDECIKLLKNLEQRWSGASRSRVIVEQLLASHRRRHEYENVDSSTNRSSSSDARLSGNKRRFDDAGLENARFGSNDNNDNTMWQQAPLSELMGVDLSELMAFNIL